MNPIKNWSTNGPLAPRLPFWHFATAICGVSEPDSKVQLTTAQRAIWKSYDRQVALTGEEADAYREMAQKEPWKVGDKAPPFFLMTLTRGGGKSLLLATIAVYEAATNSYLAAPGETVAVVALAPRKKQAKDMIGYAKAHFGRPGLAPFVARMPEEEILLRNGRSIRIVAIDTSGGAARGPTYIASLFDESAFLGFEGKIVDADQWKAIIAGARGVKDFHGILSSTPNGEHGFFFETFDEHHGKIDGAWEVFHGPQPLVRPEMPMELLDEYKRADEEAFKREFLCDFKAGTGVEKFFNKHHVEACVQAGIIEIPPSGPTLQYVCAVDPTGGAHDRMTMTIVERTPDGSVRQCLVRGWDPTQDNAPTVHDIAKEISELVEPYGITTVYGDVFGGTWVTEAFAAVGLEYETRGFNGPQKVQRASLLRELFTTGRIELLDEPIQIRELIEYEKKTLPSGNISVNHPNTKSGSDDYLDSLALAAWELVGNDITLHPPEQLVKYDPKKYLELYDSEKYPGYVGRGPFLSFEEIVSNGEGPKWIMANWFKTWRTSVLSIGELSHIAGIGPVPMINHLGRDVVLQLCWMRWLLGYWIADRKKTDWILEQNIYFPSIPTWMEICSKIKKHGHKNIVTFGSAGSEDQGSMDLPSDWQPMKVRGTGQSNGLSKQPCRPPWTAPKSEWGLDEVIRSGHDHWTDRAWAQTVEAEFARGLRIKQELELAGDTVLERNW